jgi:hypothetical protein
MTVTVRSPSILGGLGLAALGAKVDDAAAKPTLDKSGPRK